MQSGVRLAMAQVPRRPALQVRLDTNASGDFTLMSRDDWFLLKGYPEFQMFSMHLDSLLLYQAHYCGIREVILPYPIYHITHGAGWGLSAEQSSLTETLNSKGIPYVSYPRFLEIVDVFSRSKGRIRLNGVNWGLTDQQLEEIHPTGLSFNTVSTPSEANRRAE